MIASSRPILILCAVSAAGFHIAGFAATSTPQQIKIAAAGAPAAVKQGSAFADMATGVMSNVVTADTSVQPNMADQSTPPADPPQTPETTPPEPTATEPVPPATGSPTALVQTGNTAVVAVPTTTATPSETTPAITPTATPSVAPTETITAEALDPSVVLTSLRPVRRPPGLAPPTPPAPSPTPPGNANRNANAGVIQQATPLATETASGSNARAAAPSVTVSNAREVSNYPGQVMRRISRVRKPRTNVSGSALIEFTISGNGALAALSVSRSSGNAQLDQMAAQVIQRAAPFPAPPSGAQTRFRVEITGR
jgi:protein TonB